MTMQKIEILSNPSLMGGTGKTAVDTMRAEGNDARVSIEYDEYHKVGVPEPVDDAHLCHSESLDRTEVAFRVAGALGPFNK